MLRRVCGGVALAGMLAGAAPAGEAADLLREHLYAGTIERGAEAVEALIAAGQPSPEASFALGLLQFMGGIEDLAQALYRHGLASPDTGRMVPDLAVPVPVNPEPEPLDYDKVQQVLAALQEQLDVAATQLLEAGRSEGPGADFVIDLEPLKVRIDLDGDGASDDTEVLATILSRAFGGDENAFREDERPSEAPTIASPSAAPAPTPSPRAQSRSQRGPVSPQRAPAVPEPEPTPPAIADAPVAQATMTLGIDRADAIWLAGYSNIVAAQADFLLAHDFSELVATAFHRLFPRAGLPMQGQVSQGGIGIMDAESDTAIADAIAAVHSLNWPVVEPERLKRVLTRAKTVTGLSRENWRAILAETDDHFELVPSPRQTSPQTDLRVTDEVVAAWHATLDTVDQVLDGKLLLPHWRFRGGFDLKAYFETATRTDLVLIMSGYGAIPFIREGEIANAESFAAMNSVMGEDWLGFAFWFN